MGKILAYFSSTEEAREVLHKLQALRVEEARIDRIAPYSGQSPDMAANAAAIETAGFSGFVQGTAEATPTGAAVITPEPEDSGIRQGEGVGANGRDILLTAVVDDSVRHKAVRLVEEAGGVL